MEIEDSFSGNHFWSPGRARLASVPYGHDYIPPPPGPYAVTLNGRGASNQGWSIYERMSTLPSALGSFPGTSVSPVRILVLGNMSRDVNPRQRPEPPPRFINQSPAPPQPPSHSNDDSLLTQEEQKKALGKLKKEIYNPTPKRIIQRLSMYYRDNNNNSGENGKEMDEDGKSCAVCLEDFEPKQVVVLTPCNHMFHEDCIVTWVKSHGQCPVCRFAICERVKQSRVAPDNGSADDPFMSDLISFMRAINEARGGPSRGANIPYWF